MRSFIFKELDKAKIVEELLKFISNVKSDLDIIFPYNVHHLLLNQEIANMIVNKKLNGNIKIKLLYYYNSNTKPIIKKISPFVLSKRLEFSINDLYLFIRDSNDFLIIDIDKLSAINKIIGLHEFKFHNYNNMIENDHGKNVDLAYLLYSDNKSLLTYLKFLFQALWFQKETYDKIIEEKSHSDLLVDLITHDIGNHHAIIQGGLDLISDLIDTKLKQEENNLTNNSYNDSKIVYLNKDNIVPPVGNMSKASNYKNDIQNMKIVVTYDTLKEILSYISMIQNALDRSQDLVKNIIRLERMYRQKEVDLYKKNISQSIEEAKLVFSNQNNDKYNNFSDKEIKLDVSIPEILKKEDINIMADDLLKEIFINIFSNSLKYNNKQNIVPIHITISEYYISDMKYWMILVSDYGTGISDTLKEGLFERFYSKASGSGLGLSIVRALVERYNGRVWASDRVASSHKEGVTIGMLFPQYIN
jgi:signal transduction histidine kinase